MDRVVALPVALHEPVVIQMCTAEAMVNLPEDLPGSVTKKHPRPIRRRQGLAIPGREAARLSAHRQASALPYACGHNVQRAALQMAAKARVGAKVTPHILRHTFATHAHGVGAAVRDLQAVLGHIRLETTMRWLEARPAAVRSPLNDLASAAAR